MISKRTVLVTAAATSVPLLRRWCAARAPLLSHRCAAAAPLVRRYCAASAPLLAPLLALPLAMLIDQCPRGPPRAGGGGTSVQFSSVR